MAKTAVALLFVLNVAVLVWLRTLPDDSPITGGVLEQDASGNVVALEAQVRCGRMYRRAFVEHVTANRVASGVLLADTCFLLLVALALSVRENFICNRFLFGCVGAELEG